MKGGGTILVIDDDELLCDMLASLLELEGLSVVVAHDGATGLEYCRNRIFDCILLDLVMPRMDGLQFMRTIGRHVPQHAPIIVMSASVTATILEEGRDYGVATMVRKPIETDILLAAISAAMV
ncbi:response regulator [Erythrobacter litoralis]|uniref:response regulator n=1 Tax=Erythrobacter litoralis TaxID=39960 RepID=UPI0024351974|nr:response regulator [Erythrobacter litoralis]MDG6079409.1 response regulator [Erythrobacter litoralis]